MNALDQFVIERAIDSLARPNATPEDWADTAERFLADRATDRQACSLCGRMTVFGCKGCGTPLCGWRECSGDCACGGDRG